MAGHHGPRWVIGLLITCGVLAGPAASAHAGSTGLEITQAQSPATLSAGGTFTDTVTLSSTGGAVPSPLPGGAVTFDVYGPGNTTCSGTAVAIDTEPINSGGTSISDPFTLTTPGTYEVVASYAGDSLYAQTTTACGDPHGVVTVTGTTRITIAAQASPAQGTAGGLFEDTATLTAPLSAPAPTGSVTFDVYGPGAASCTNPSYTASVPLAGQGTTVSSGEFPLNVPGDYEVVATYSGDSQYASAASSCGDPDGAVAVAEAPVQIAAQVTPAALALGGSFLDTATLTPPLQGQTPTGDVMFLVFAPTDTTCTADPIFSSDQKLGASGTTATSDAFTPLTLGTYRVVAAYGGDAHYAAASTRCSDPAGSVVVGEGGPPSAGGSLLNVSIASPFDGAHYVQGEAIDAAYACSDERGITDLESCGGPTPNGSPIDTGASGFHTFEVSARGADGETASETVTYFVDAVGGAGVSTTANSSAGPGSRAPGGRPGRPIAPRRPIAGGGAASQPGGAGPQAPAGGGAGAASAARPARRAAPAAPRPGLPTAPGLALRRFSVSSDANSVIALEIAAFALLTLGGGSGLALAGRAVASTARARTSAAPGELGPRPLPDDDSDFDADRDSPDVDYLVAHAGLGAGDRSRTWRWPGTRILDTVSKAAPARLAGRSPLLARVVDDSAYLRSAFGSLAITTQLAGVGLGVLAVDQTGGRALPPGLALTIGIAVLGVFDAAAGFVAVLTFVVGLAALGGLDSVSAVRTLLGLGILWFAVPVIAGAARPLRRDPPTDSKQRFDRAADVAIASLIGAWAVQEITKALPGLAGYHLPIAAHADQVALWVLGALVVRMICETLAARLYPRRLVTVEPQGLHEPRSPERLAAAGLRVGLYVLVATVAVHPTWQLFVAAGLLLVPQVLDVYNEHLPKSSSLAKAVPDGLVAVVLMLFLLTGLGAILLNTHSRSLIADSFVLLAAPGALLAVLQQFRRERAPRTTGWARRVAGTGILVVGTLQVLGLLF